MINRWCIYLLKCSDQTIYTGITNNLQKRIDAHNNKTGAKYTKGRTPVSLLKSFIVKNKSIALKIERKIKKMSKKQKINLSKDMIYLLQKELL